MIPISGKSSTLTFESSSDGGDFGMPFAWQLPSVTASLTLPTSWWGFSRAQTHTFCGPLYQIWIETMVYIKYVARALAQPI